MSFFWVSFGAAFIIGVAFWTWLEIHQRIKRKFEDARRSWSGELYDR